MSSSMTCHILIRLRPSIYYQEITCSYGYVMICYLVFLFFHYDTKTTHNVHKKLNHTEMTNTAQRRRKKRKKNEFTSFHFYLSESIQSNHNKIKITQITWISEKGEKRNFSNYCDWVSVFKVLVCCISLIHTQSHNFGIRTATKTANSHMLTLCSTECHLAVCLWNWWQSKHIRII